MKKMMILFVALAAAWCVSCSKDDDGVRTPEDSAEETGLTMKSEGQKISLILVSKISKITIDWGDGTVKEYDGEYSESSNLYGYGFTVNYEYSQNALHTIKISGCTDLLYLDCSGNRLSSLDVSRCPALTWLECYDNQLPSLDVSGCTHLTEFYCSDNQLSSLDVSECTHLTEFYCSSNQLPSLDVSGCSALTILGCSLNQLSLLDVTGCPALTNLFCNENQLSSLDVSGCPALTELYCYTNQFSASALNQIYTDLPTTDGRIVANSNPGYPESDKSIATGKGWVFSEE